MRLNRPGSLIGTLAMLLLMLATGCASEDEQQRLVQQMQRELRGDPLAWDLLQSLTHEVGPRMAGTPGDALALEWARRNMLALGFDRVWSEPVEFPRWRRGQERVAVIAPRALEMVATALGGTPSTGGVLSAEVVHFPSLADLEAADPTTVEGRIAFISARMERLRDGSDYSRVVEGRSKGPFVAARKGAAALVIRSVGTDSERFAHTGMVSTTEEGEPVPAAALSNPDADWLVAQLGRGQPVTMELDLDVGFEGTASSQNVIGEYDGSDPDAGFVVLGAHLDSWDLGMGAVDDGVGVAIVLAAARWVAGLPVRPRRGLRVVLFANEEQGIYGGKAYAEAHADELRLHVLGAEADFGAGRVWRFRHRVQASALPSLERLAEWLEPLGVVRVDDPPAKGGADLGRMRMLGMPAIDLDHDASRYFDLHHTANDTLDKVNPADLGFNVAVYATLLYFASETEVVFGPVAPSE